MVDVLMVAKPRDYKNRGQIGSCKPEFLSAEEFFEREYLYREYEEELWRHFHTRGKRMGIEKCARWFAVASSSMPNAHYLGSACVIVLGEKWIVEYVMTKTEFQNQGIGSALMDWVMGQARNRNARWVILNCDPEKEKGKLLHFYKKFGFAVVA